MTDATSHHGINVTNIAQMRSSSHSPRHDSFDLNNSELQPPHFHHTNIGDVEQEGHPRLGSINSINSGTSSSPGSSSSCSTSHLSSISNSSSSKSKPKLTLYHQIAVTVTSYIGGHTAWITSNLTWSRLKPAIRCAIAGWLSMLLLVIPDVLKLMGQASFLVLIASFFSPPSDPFLFVLEREFFILLFSATAWAWSCLGIFLANLTRSEEVRDVTLLDVVDGKYIEARPIVILAIFVFLGSAFFLFIKAKMGPSAYTFACVFACICLDISLTTAAFYPFPLFMVGRSILIPLAFHSALALLCSIFIFPSTVSALFTTRIIECIVPLQTALTKHLSLFDPEIYPLGSAEFSTLLTDMRKDTKNCESALIPLASTGRLLGNDVIFARFKPDDWRLFQALCRRLVGRLDGVGMYWGLIDPKRERFPGTASTNHEAEKGHPHTPGAITPGITPFPSMPGTPVGRRSRAPSPERIRGRGSSMDRIRSRRASVDRGRSRTGSVERERRGHTPEHIMSKETDHYGYAHPTPTSPLVKNHTMRDESPDDERRGRHRRSTHTSHVHFGETGEEEGSRNSLSSPAFPSTSSKGQYYGIVEGSGSGGKRKHERSGSGHALFHSHGHGHLSHGHSRLHPSISSPTPSSPLDPLSPSTTKNSGYETPSNGSTNSQDHHHHVMLHNSLLAATKRGAKKAKKRTLGGIGNSFAGSIAGSLTGDEEAEVGRFETQRYLNLEATRIRKGENEDQEQEWVREGMGLLRECCAPLIEQCISAAADVTTWLGTVRGGRLGSLLKIRKEQREKEGADRLNKLKSVREDLVKTLDRFRDVTRTLVVEPYKIGFLKSEDPETVFKEEISKDGELLARAEAVTKEGNWDGNGASTLFGGMDETPPSLIQGHKEESVHDHHDGSPTNNNESRGNPEDERHTATEKPKDKRHMPPHRYLFHCYVYQYHLIQIAVILIEMLDEMIRLEEERVECQLWTPVHKMFGILRGWGETSLIDSEQVEDDDPDYIQGLHHGRVSTPPIPTPPVDTSPHTHHTTLPQLITSLPLPHSHLDDLNFPHRRDPDALPPRNLFEALMNALYELIISIRGGNVQFAIKAGILSVLLCMPFFLKHSAQWAYENRFFWAVVMGQMTIARFRGDTTFGLFARIVSTFFGGITGMVLWYISAGTGHGNAYGLAATFLVCAPFFYFARLYWPIPQMTNIVFFVTAVLVLGYSYQDNILVAPGSVGSGWNVAWKRFVFVSLGVFAAFLFSYFPPATTIRRYHRQLLSTTTSEIGSIYCSVLTFANTKHEPEVQEIIRSLIAVRAKLNRGGVMTVNVGYEFSLRGRWPQKRYQKIADLQMAISYSLGHLMSVIEHLDPAWARAFLRRTRFMDPDFQGDVLAVISMVSSCLRTGTPLPQVTPCPLQDRFMLRYHELEVIHKEAEEDYGLPRIMTLETLRDEQYMIFCVGVATAFAIVNRLDRLMMAAKELLGEQYHIHGIGLPGGVVMAELHSRGHYGPFGEDRRSGSHLALQKEKEKENVRGRDRAGVSEDVEKGMGRELE